LSVKDSLEKHVFQAAPGRNETRFIPTRENISSRERKLSLLTDTERIGSGGFDDFNSIQFLFATFSEL